MYAEHSLGIVNRQKISKRDKMMKQGQIDNCGVLFRDVKSSNKMTSFYFNNEKFALRTQYP